MDLDGTLLNSESKVPEENARSIAEAAARGIEIVVVTGRRWHSARLIVEALPCELHMIVNNGALIKSKAGETHQRMLLPAATARKVLLATPEFRRSASVVFDRPRENQVILEEVDWDDPFRGGYFRRSREFVAEVKPLEKCLEPGFPSAAKAGEERDGGMSDMNVRPPKRPEEPASAAKAGEERGGGMSDMNVRPPKRPEEPASTAEAGEERGGGMSDMNVRPPKRPEEPASAAKAGEERGRGMSDMNVRPPKRPEEPASAAEASEEKDGGMSDMNVRPPTNHEDPIQVMFVGLCATVQDALTKLRSLPFADEYKLAFTEYLTRDISVLDVLGRGVSKGVALAEWARRLGVRREEVMAIGDNWNDCEMLEYAGLPVVMGNSVEGLKTRGWTVTLSNDENGLAEAVKRYALQ